MQYIERTYTHTRIRKCLAVSQQFQQFQRSGSFIAVSQQFHSSFIEILKIESRGRIYKYKIKNKYRE